MEDTIIVKLKCSLSQSDAACRKMYLENSFCTYHKSKDALSLISHSALSGEHKQLQLVLDLYLGCVRVWGVIRCQEYPLPVSVPVGTQGRTAVSSLLCSEVVLALYFLVPLMQEHLVYLLIGLLDMFLTFGLLHLFCLLCHLFARRSMDVHLADSHWEM
jgi:hypothetical protein